MNAITPHRRTTGRSRVWLAAAIVACLATGCTVAVASPSPVDEPTHTAIASPTEPTAALATPSPTATLAPTVPASVGPAPAGPWTGIRWISAGAAFPQTPVPDVGSQSSVQVGVFGWSHGYAGFRTAISQTYSRAGPYETKWVTVATASADGLHWTPGKTLDEGDEAGPWVVVSGLVEGPAGLLAVGRYPAAVCGGPPTVGALWTSADGLAWTRVTPPADFASASVYTVDGGSTGYIATGMLRDGITPAVWVSADGRSWRRSTLPRPTSGAILVDGGTAFAGGYVISGAQRLDIGCAMSEVVPSLWWSAGGTSWAAADVPEALPVDYALVTVNRVSDHALMAIAQEWDAAGQPVGQPIWVTHDGRSWLLVKSPSGLLSPSLLTNGQRGVMVVHPPSGGPATIATVDDDLTVTVLSQSGDGPDAPDTSSAWVAALGPTGLVALTTDGLDLWLGVPSAS
jgi:hypothetical protein